MIDGEEHVHGPWVDVHSHPGCGFLGGLAPSDPLVKTFGGDRSQERVPTAEAGEVSAVNVSTVADLAVLGIAASGPTALREFEPGEAERDHQRQIGAISQVLGHNQVVAVLRAADVSSAQAEGRTGVFLGCEGADFLDGDGGGLAGAYDDGVRAITLVHYRVNELGDIQTEDSVHDGLTPFGIEVVGEMNRLGMIVDLAHATFETTTGALNVSTAPIMISHSHLASPGADHPRLLSVKHARVVADAGGIIGAWPAGIASSTLDDYVDEICRLIEVVGTDHVAIGTDLDANYRPVLTSYEQFPDVAAALALRGLDHSEIDDVLGGNFIRVFGQVELASAH
jgi:membrane dipeptidase